jgi:hypothetical protein
MNETNTSLISSISSNAFLRDCIDLAIDGFLFRGVTPADHYYRFSQSFPKAFTFVGTSSNLAGATSSTTPKVAHRSHHHHHNHHHQQLLSSTTSSTPQSKTSTSQPRTNNVPPLDLSSLNSHVLLEQQPVSTIMSTNTAGLTVKTKKPVDSLQ